MNRAARQLLMVFLVFITLSTSFRTAQAASTTFDLRLVGAFENPAVNDDPARASVQLVFDDASKTLAWSLTITGVSADLITGAHIHRGAFGINGPVIYPLATGGGPTTSGKITLTDADVADLKAGDLYVNIHTAAHPNGAARSQIVSPLELLHLQQLAALNRGDVNATLTYFLDNAVSHVGGCAQKACEGKEAIRGEAVAETGQHIKVSILSYSVSGNTVSDYGEVSEDQFHGLGIERLRFFFSTTYSGDKIASTAADPDFNDQQTRMLLQMGAPPAIRPPATGDGGLVD